MNKVLVLLTVLLAGCASSPEEKYAEWENCVAVAVAEERDAHSRPECDKKHEHMMRAQESRLIRQRGRPTCPQGMVSHCRGPSCGRAPRHRNDYRDYMCVDRAAHKEWMRQLQQEITRY